MKSNFNFYRTEQGGQMKLWNTHGDFDDNAMEQLKNTANLPFIHRHIAGMPDVHFGMGATIGSVVPTLGAIVPAAVGVDLGCGVVAVQTTLKAHDLPDDLKGIRSEIERLIPHGRTNNGQRGDRGAWFNIPDVITSSWVTLENEYNLLVEKHPKVKAHNTVSQLGTLGTGNHFVEVCLDESDSVWVMLHSGSRGVGNKIGTYFIGKAQEEMRRYYIDKYQADKDLSFLVEHTEIFNDYVKAVDWAQRYAALNRDIMLDNVMRALKTKISKPFNVVNEAINCHHNYISKEYHFNENVWVTRKGAVRARKDELGIIPGSMGTGSFIVRGLGNKESFCSCSHGAGRVMSRREAKKRISIDDHKKAMEGIEARLDADVIDESPAAYKDIGAVMKAQSDLVEIVAKLKQVVNVKG